MAEKTFQCQVNKSHLKRMPEGSMMVPYCRQHDSFLWSAESSCAPRVTTG